MAVISPELAIQVVVAAMLLFAGRRLVWLAVAALGFGVGVHLVARLGLEIGVHPWVVALAAGLIGAALALLVQRVAVTVGFALLGAALAGWLATTAEPVQILLAVGLGAVLGAILARTLFALAVAILTASAGGLLLASLLPLGAAQRPLVAAVAALVGVLVQLRGRRAQPEKPKKAGKDEL